LKEEASKRKEREREGKRKENQIGRQTTISDRGGAARVGRAAGAGRNTAAADAAGVTENRGENKAAAAAVGEEPCPACLRPRALS